MDIAEIIGIGIAGMLVGLIIFIVGETVGEEKAKRLKEEIVKRGHAIWKADEKGRTEFEWKEPKK